MKFVFQMASIFIVTTLVIILFQSNPQESSRTIASLDKVPHTEASNCKSAIALFFRKNLIKRNNKFEFVENGPATRLFSDEVYEEYYTLSDGSVIYTRDIELGKNLKDSSGRNWFVRGLSEKTGQFKIEGNGVVITARLNSSVAYYQPYRLIIDGVEKLNIFLPVTDPKATKKYKEIARELIENTPPGYFDFTNEIIFADGPAKNDLIVDARFLFATQSIIIFPRQTMKNKLKEVKITLWHEIGHGYVHSLFSKYELFARWNEAMGLDKNFVTEYAKTNAEEDFAETIAYYILYDGGRLKPSLRKDFDRRFEILDEIMGQDENIKKILKQYLMIKRGMYGVFTFSAGYGIYYYQENREGTDN